MHWMRSCSPSKTNVTLHNAPNVVEVLPGIRDVSVGIRSLYVTEAEITCRFSAPR